MNITFIGMGLMGIPMARNLITKWWNTTIYNRTPWKADELVSLGAREALSLEEAVWDADVLISMVTAGEDVEKLVIQSMSTLKPWAVWIDMSTIGVKWARHISRILGTVWVSWIDAPVTGSTPKAIIGELTIFVWGDREVFTTIEPVLSDMGTNIQYMWDIGMWQAMKLVNNTLVAYSMIWLAEVMKLAGSMGIEPSRTAEVVKTIPVSSPYTAMKVDNYVTHTYPLMFSVANMSKDIDLAYDMMKDGDISLQYLSYAHMLYTRAVESGIGGEDLSAIENMI